MRGRIPDDEDVWLYKKWKTEVNVDSLLEATLPPGLIEDEVGTYVALVLVGWVSELSNEAPSLLDEEASPPRVAEPLDAGTPEQDIVVTVTPSKVAEPKPKHAWKHPLAIGRNKEVPRSGSQIQTVKAHIGTMHPMARTNQWSPSQSSLLTKNMWRRLQAQPTIV